MNEEKTQAASIPPYSGPPLDPDEYLLWPISARLRWIAKCAGDGSYQPHEVEKHLRETTCYVERVERIASLSKVLHDLIVSGD